VDYLHHADFVYNKFSQDASSVRLLVLLMLSMIRMPVDAKIFASLLVDNNNNRILQNL